MAGTLTPTTPASADLVFPEGQYQGAHDADIATRNDGSALQDGDLYFNLTLPAMKAWDGAIWVVAPQGATGPQGPIGPTGATGATGATGPQGIQGDQGIQGIQGIQGDQGLQGDQGIQGIQGIQGVQGDKGLNWLGAYSGATAYVLDDAVSYQGASYVCIQAGTGNTPAVGGTAFWDELAVKGADGAGSGDMLAATYDPTTVASDAFAMDNMVEGATTKILTATERTNIANSVTHAANSTIHFTEASIVHQNISGAGTNTHAQIDTHITTANPHSGSAASGANNDITSISGLTTALSIAQGGTGQTTQQAAIDALTNVSAATNEHVLTKDTATGNAVFKAAPAGGGGGYTWLIKTAAYTMVDNDGILADSTAGVFTLTLPATPTSGEKVFISDGASASSWGTNNVTVARNGSTIEGAAADFTLDVDDGWAEFVYDGVTWQVRTDFASGGGGFAAGTKMVFYQSAAPTGWTKDTTAGLDIAGLRLVTTTAWAAGATGTADPFAAHTHTTSATALSIAQLAAHDHTVDMNGHSASAGNNVEQTRSETFAKTKTTNQTGSGSTHTHGATGGNTAPKFVNVILASKD